MPRLKQPIPLEETSMDVLIECFRYFLRKCTLEESFAELRKGVAFIKTEIRPRLPATLAVELYNTMLYQFERQDSIASETRCVRIISEVLMDDDIIGLRFLHKIMFALEPNDLIRIRGITELELFAKIPHSLEMVNLKDVTVFKYRRHCTDSDLVALSEHCAKLELVDVAESDNVTDLGLCALTSASCPDLRSLSVACCPNISISGLIRFLSVNETIRELFAWRNSDSPGFDFSEDPNWHSDPSQYRSVETITIGTDCENVDLLCVVAKFPNLRSIEISGNFVGDIEILESLTNLSTIDFDTVKWPTWDEFEHFLERVAPRIRHLVVAYDEIDATQRGLNSIYRICEHLESLHFKTARESREAELAVPPFEKLRHLTCALYNPDIDDPKTTLRFGRMPELESLRIDGFVLGQNGIKSMIIDSTNFPNVKDIFLSEFDFGTDLHSIEQDVARNNLDLRLGVLGRSYD